MSKQIHAKPQLYAYYFLALKEIAKEMGYNLVVHGSMARDMDLIAIPWTDDSKQEMELINALAQYMNGKTYDQDAFFQYKELPGGRHSYIINLYRGGYTLNHHGEITDPLEFTEDPQYYIDISITPNKR